MDQVFREITLIASVFSSLGERPFPIRTKRDMRTKKVIADQRLAEQTDAKQPSSDSRPFLQEEKDVRDRILELIGSESGASFSRLTGIPESSLRAYLKGTKPGTDHLISIAQAKGVTIDWLATGREPKLRADLVTAMKGVDRQRLQDTIAAIEEGLRVAQKRLSPDKHAELICLIYDADGPVNRAIVIGMIAFSST